MDGDAFVFAISDYMGAAIARDGSVTLQTIVSAIMRTKLELAFAGLDGSGKSTLASVLRDPGEPLGGSIPTIGLVVTRARQRGIELMLWDLGGHHRFRDDWQRHVRDCGALVYLVDASDPARFAESRQALARLLEDPVVGRLPLLVLATKIDLLPPADRAVMEMQGWRELAHELHLDREPGQAPGGGGHWSILGVSATRGVNLTKVLRWIVLQAHGAGKPESSSDALDGSGDPGSTRRRASRLWHAMWGSRVGRKGSAWWGFTSVGELHETLVE